MNSSETIDIFNGLLKTINGLVKSFKFTMVSIKNGTFLWLQFPFWILIMLFCSHPWYSLLNAPSSSLCVLSVLHSFLLNLLLNLNLNRKLNKAKCKWKQCAHLLAFIEKSILRGISLLCTVNVRFQQIWVLQMLICTAVNSWFATIFFVQWYIKPIVNLQNSVDHCPQNFKNFWNQWWWWWWWWSNSVKTIEKPWNSMVACKKNIYHRTEKLNIVVVWRYNTRSFQDL